MGGLIRLLWIAAFWLLISGVRRLFLPSPLPHRDREKKKEQEDVLLLQDPQCGRFVPEQDAVTAFFQGQTLHFCSQECRDLYITPKSPEGKKN